MMLRLHWGIEIRHYCDVKELSECVQKDSSLIAMWEKYCDFSMSREDKKRF
jgi:hypothetical protein